MYLLYIFIFFNPPPHYEILRTGLDGIINTVEKYIINQYGPPLIYISDNGFSFTSAKFQQILEKYEIEPEFVKPAIYTLIKRSN